MIAGDPIALLGSVESRQRIVELGSSLPGNSLKICDLRIPQTRDVEAPWALCMVLQTAGQLARGLVSSVALVEAALARAEDRRGEGARVFTRLYRDSAIAAAHESDRLRSCGVVRSTLEGIPVSIKDLFDVRGDITLAGSKVLRRTPAATSDAPVVARLRAAGAIIVGRTNMTEFAFSGVGLNPHYGTPRNPFDRATGRIPGGSSSGAAVSVSDQMALLGIGTDTGGSVRIPAALCGLVGFKPSADRIPRSGMVPLSSTLDSVGPIAHSVACCAIADAVMAGEQPVVPPALPITGVRLGVVRDYVCGGLDHTVEQAFERALKALACAGAVIQDASFPELERVQRINRSGGFAGPEAFAWHRLLLDQFGHEYDPRVAVRIRFAQSMSAADYVALGAQRAALIDCARRVAEPFDALLMPTVPIVAPEVAQLERSDEAFGRANFQMLRNPSMVNFLDGCALSLPMHAGDELPSGLMVVGMRGADRVLLQAGQAIESVLQGLARDVPRPLAAS